MEEVNIGPPQSDGDFVKLRIAYKLSDLFDLGIKLLKRVIFALKLRSQKAHSKIADFYGCSAKKES